MEHGDPGWKKAMYGIDKDFKSDTNIALIAIENRGPRGGLKECDYAVVRLDFLPLFVHQIDDSISSFLYCTKTVKKMFGGKMEEFLDNDEMAMVKNWTQG